MKAHGRLFRNATEATIDDILDASYWRGLVPFLHLGQMDLTDTSMVSTACSSLEAQHILQWRKKVKQFPLLDAA